MFEKIKEILKKEYGIAELDMNANIKKDLGLSSFDFANLICIIEDELEIEIDEEMYRKIVTVQDFVDYLDTINP